MPSWFVTHIVNFLGDVYQVFKLSIIQHPSLFVKVYGTSMSKWYLPFKQELFVGWIVRNICAVNTNILKSLVVTVSDQQVLGKSSKTWFHPSFKDFGLYFVECQVVWSSISGIWMLSVI